MTLAARASQLPAGAPEAGRFKGHVPNSDTPVGTPVRGVPRHATSRDMEEERAANPAEYQWSCSIRAAGQTAAVARLHDEPGVRT